MGFTLGSMICAFFVGALLVWALMGGPQRLWRSTRATAAKAFSLVTHALDPALGKTKVNAGVQTDFPLPQVPPPPPADHLPAREVVREVYILKNPTRSRFPSMGNAFM